MRKKYAVIGILLLLLLVFGMSQLIYNTQITIRKYYEQLKDQTKSKEEEKNQMEAYLLKHKKAYLIKEIISDTTSLTVKFWYGVTTGYSFLEEGFDN